MIRRFLILYFVVSITAGVWAQAPLDANTVFSYDAAKPLNLKVGNAELVGAVSVSAISYESPKGGRVQGYLVVPPGKGPFAAIVYMHWGQANSSEFLSEAVAMANVGAIGIMIDAPYWRQAAPRPDPAKRAENERDVYIQMVTDLRRAVDVLAARNDVDPKRIGYVGHSLGATWGAPLAAAEKRIKVLVLMGGLLKVPPDWDDDSFYQQFQRVTTPRAEFDKEVEVMKPYQPENFAANTGPAKIYFQWAKHDMFISQRSAEEYFKAVAGPKEQRWYFTSHEFNDDQSRADRSAWLAKELGLSSRQRH